MPGIEQWLIVIEIPVTDCVIRVHTSATASRAESGQLDHNCLCTLDRGLLVDIGGIGDMDGDEVAIISDEIDPPPVVLVSDLRVGQMHEITPPSSL